MQGNTGEIQNWETKCEIWEVTTVLFIPNTAEKNLTRAYERKSLKERERVGDVTWLKFNSTNSNKRITFWRLEAQIYGEIQQHRNWKHKKNLVKTRNPGFNKTKTGVAVTGTRSNTSGCNGFPVVLEGQTWACPSTSVQQQNMKHQCINRDSEGMAWVSSSLHIVQSNWRK